jgi:hypothetical protein
MSGQAENSAIEVDISSMMEQVQRMVENTVTVALSNFTNPSAGNNPTTTDPAINNVSSVTEEGAAVGTPVDDEAATNDQQPINAFQNLLEQKSAEPESESVGNTAGDLDGILQNLKQTMDTEEWGGELSTPMAEACALLVSKGVPEATLTDTRRKYLTPANCKVIAPPTVNKVIFNLLPQAIRVKDVAQQKHQANLSAAMTAVAMAMDEIKTAASMVPSLSKSFQKMTDALTLMAAVNKDINVKRREDIKVVLDPHYKHICSSSVPITQSLFGDNIEETIKKQGDANKMQSLVLGQHVNNNNKPKAAFHGVARGKVFKPVYKPASGRGQQQRGRGFHRGQSQPRGRARGNSWRGRH